jgi:hypothetical protein
VDNAALAQNSVLLRGGKTSHSSRAQLRSVIEFTDCGQSRRYRSGRFMEQHSFADAQVSL